MMSQVLTLWGTGGAWRISQAREVIAEAVRRLPATADMLYLEYCYDNCEAVK